MNHWVGENSLLNSPWVEKQKQNLTVWKWMVGGCYTSSLGLQQGCSWRIPGG